MEFSPVDLGLMYNELMASLGFLNYDWCFVVLVLGI
jgi:hypothetical protein